MKVVRIGSLAPPDSGRSKWAREHLGRAIEKELDPVIVPAHKIVSFTATLPPYLADQIKAISEAAELSPVATAAGLIEASIGFENPDEKSDTDVQTMAPSIAGADRVRPVLHKLLSSTCEGLDQGKIVFAEAATGTGKGRMIAALAANAASKGDSVVVSAPLAVTWQLMADLSELEEAKSFGFDLILGRANFVSPEALKAWATEEGHEELLNWIANGGLPLSDRAVKASALLSKPLRWLLEDALFLEEDLPISAVMLDVGADESCEGEQAYQQLRNDKGAAAIVFCSHHLLASHVRQSQLMGLDNDDDHPSLPLPKFIDTLIVDEAHMLESAFAAIYSHSLHLRPMIKAVEREIRTGRTALVEALKALSDCVTEVTATENGKKLQTLNSVEGLSELLQRLDSSIQKALPSKKKKDSSIHIQLGLARNGIRAALSGSMNIKFEVSPVKKYPQLVIGRASLEKAMAYLWDNVAGAALVSATLYSDDNSAKLIRWKLGVPPSRALYLSPIHPAWVANAVQLHADRVTKHPDDTDEWLDDLAIKVREIADGARGGTLVLCTSHQNTQGLANRLQDHLGQRLIVQSQTMNAATCAALFRCSLSNKGLKPVWIGLGAAWTGINLSDETQPAELDSILTDLVITRLPLGINRSITHERRVAIAGFGVAAQEAAWQLRQGIGRLVRREGVAQRQLWVLDSRLDKKISWVTPFKRILKRYQP